MNTHAMLKISDIIRNELIPTVSYEDKEILYKIADSWDTLVIATKAGMPISFNGVRDYTKELLPEEDIHDLLASYNL